ncbi:MAG: outer membrane beta-barrel protein [Bdellovibrionota bacterium]
MKKPHSTLIAILTMASFASLAKAEDKPPTFQWNVNGDTYYSYNFNRPAAVTQTSANPSANNTYRYYDSYHNELALGLAELSLKAQKGDVSVVTDLDFGSFADLNAAQPSGAVDEVSKHIGQFVLSYRADGSRWAFDLGKMYTHVGLETPKAKDNWQYSRSILMAYGMPFWHTGLRAGYDVLPNELTASVYIYNGWNSIHDNNSAKTLGGQLKWAKGSTTAVYNYIGGPEQARNESNWKVIHEVNVTTDFLPSWQVGIDALTGREKNVVIGSATTATPSASWYGATLAVKGQLTEKTYISPRYEWYRDNQGLTLVGGAQTVQTGTLTVGHQLNSALQVRAEGRRDWSNQNNFRDGNLVKKNQNTALVGVLLTI